MRETKDTEAAGRLRSARIKAGFPSASAAARHHQWGEAAYRHHENGTRAFSIDQAVQYANAFKVSASWLLALSTQSASARVPIARFYTQVFAENMGEGSEVYDLIDSMFESLGLVMFPELHVSERDIEWVVGPTGLPPMLFLHPNEIDVDRTVISQGYVFAYRVSHQSSGSGLAPGNLTLVDSSVGNIGHLPSLYLLRGEDRVFIRAARQPKSGPALLMPEEAGAAAQTFEDVEPIAILGKVVWASHRT